MIVDRIGPGPADNHIGAAVAVDGLGARAAGDGIACSRADNRQGRRDIGRIDVREFAQDREAGSGLIGRVGEIEVDRGFENEGVRRAGAAVDRAFRTVEIDDIGAGAANDDIVAAITINGLGARTARNRVRDRGTHDRQRSGDAPGVDVGEIRHGSRANDLIGGIGEIHIRSDVEIDRAGAGSAIQRSFRAVVIDQGVACPAIDDIGPAVPIDRVRARAAGDRVRRRGAQNLDGVRDRAGVYIGEVLDRCRAGRCLIAGVGEIEIDAKLQHQRVDAAGTAVEQALRAMIIEGVGAGAADDDIGPAIAIDRFRAGPALNRVGDRRAENGERRADSRSIDVDETGDGRTAGHLMGRIGEIHRRGGVEV